MRTKEQQDDQARVELCECGYRKDQHGVEGIWHEYRPAKPQASQPSPVLVSPQEPAQAREKAMAYAIGLMQDRLKVEAPYNAAIIQQYIDALAASPGIAEKEPKHRRACECATPDPVMQADAKFYCYRCSFETGARPEYLPEMSAPGIPTPSEKERE